MQYFDTITISLCQLLTTQAVHGWKSEIHEGIYDMLQLLLKLIVARLKYQPVPFGLLEMLTQVFPFFSH